MSSNAFLPPPPSKFVSDKCMLPRILFTMSIFLLFQSICAILLWISAGLNGDLVRENRQTTTMMGESLLAGTIYGINHITVICHAVDTTTPDIRDTVVRTIAYAKWLLVALAGVLFILGDTFRTIYALTALIYSLVGTMILFAVCCLVRNSVVRSLKHRVHEDVIMQQLAHIHREHIHSPQVRMAMDGWKLQLQEDQENDTNSHWRPLLLVGLARLLSVCINNVPVLIILHAMTINSTNPDGMFDFNFVVMAYHLIGKFVLGFLTVFIADCIDLNHFYYMAAMVWCVGYAMIAFLLNFSPNLKSITIIGPITLLLYEATGVGIDAISMNQLAVAFPLTKRTASIACIQIVEALTEIILIAIFLFAYWQSVVAMVLICVIAGCLLLLRFMPNTNGWPLRDARDRFNARVPRQVY